MVDILYLLHIGGFFYDLKRTKLLFLVLFR